MPGPAREAEPCERNTGAYFGLVELPGGCAPALGSCQPLAASRGASAAICCNNYFETVLSEGGKRPLDLSEY